MFYNTDPWGDWRADIRSAQIVATLANIHRDPDKHSEPYKITEFMAFERNMPKPEKDSSEGASVAPETLAWFFANAKRVEDQHDGR